jgi:hypothetical protein
MLNPFFLQGSKGEQGLIQDLINEQLRMYGVEVFYLPRQYITEKTIIKEVIESQFTSALPIEAYVDTYEGYGGQGTLLSKFGVQDIDDLTLIISRERWESYIQPLIRNKPSIKLSKRPKEGDLIYFPLGDRLFEIKFVEHEKPFYQLQGLYTYELRCELFRYEDEVIDTGIDNIDDNTAQDAIIQTLQLVGIGSTATAITGVVNGGVKSVTILNRGNNYTSAPVVAFSSAPFGGITATGIATMLGGIVDICGPDETKLRVQAVELINPGAGYTVAPKISFTGGGGSGAVGIASIGNGIVGVITVTRGGSGYVTPPTVSFSGIPTVNASARAIINDAGEVTQIRITNSGLGYITTPTITISSPNIYVGFGTYIYNEVVVGSASSVTARVKSWNAITKVLEVSNISGSFAPGETLIGQISAAQYSLKTAYTDNLGPINNLDDAYSGGDTKDRFAENRQIEIESDAILDFSEENPFGIP